MSRNRLDLVLDDGPGSTLTQRVVNLIVREIQRGRLRPGERLPGSRSLAETLGISRKTVSLAYDELALEGWVETRSRSGTFVVDTLPEGEVMEALEPRANVRRRYPATELELDDGFPDTRLAPTEELARAYRRSLVRQKRNLRVEVAGIERLRYAIAELITRARGLAVSAEQVMVTRGSQMAIYLAACVAFKHGARVAVEEPGYAPAREALVAAGHVPVPVETDSGGLCVDRLHELHEKEPIAGVFLTPHHHFPTTVSMPPDRRRRLQELVRQHRWFVIEDDYDFEYHYDSGPQLPISSIGMWKSYAYIGSFSKLIGPFIRLGFLIADAPFIERAARLRAVLDGGGDPHLEAAVCELLEDGELARHTARMRRFYRSRRDAYVGLLNEQIPTWIYDIPGGGLAFWLQKEALHSKVMESNSEAGPPWLVRALRRSRSYFVNPPMDRVVLRLGFGSLGEEEMRGIVSALRCLDTGFRES